jgi:hypothetical protein
MCAIISQWNYYDTLSKCKYMLLKKLAKCTLNSLDFGYELKSKIHNGKSRLLKKVITHI